mgnify:CR=1 FL=1
MFIFSLFPEFSSPLFKSVISSPYIMSLIGYPANLCDLVLHCILAFTNTVGTLVILYCVEDRETGRNLLDVVTSLAKANSISVNNISCITGKTLVSISGYINHAAGLTGALRYSNISIFSPWGCRIDVTKSFFCVHNQ